MVALPETKASAGPAFLALVRRESLYLTPSMRKSSGSLDSSEASASTKESSSSTRAMRAAVGMRM